MSIKKVNQSYYRPEAPRGFQEVKVASLRDNIYEYYLCKFSDCQYEFYSINLLL